MRFKKKITGKLTYHKKLFPAPAMRSRLSMASEAQEKAIHTLSMNPKKRMSR
jgi:hypothetical protein